MSFNSELVLESKYGEARSGDAEQGRGALARKTISLPRRMGDDLADLGRCRSASDGIHDYVTYSE